MFKAAGNILVLSSAILPVVAAYAQLPRTGAAAPPVPHLRPAQKIDLRDGFELFQGDIIIRKKTPPQLPRGPHAESVTTAYASSLWPKVSGIATVYYVIDANSDPNATPKINSAISIFNADFSGLIQWVPWDSSLGPNYVDINLNANDQSGVCEAAEGYDAEPAQPVEGSTACAVVTILHEMGHVIGLWHEQTRADRDTYVSLNYNNVIKSTWSNFEIVADNAQILGLFDYASIMEYGAYDFSRNGGPVLETIPAGIPLASSEGIPVPASADYSAGDKEAILRLYGAAPTQVTITSNPVGLQVIVDENTITTPQSFSWNPNTIHHLDVPSGAQSLTGDIAGTTTSSTFYYTFGRWNDSGSQAHTIQITPGDGRPGTPTTSPLYATYSANFIELVPYTTSTYPSGAGTVAVSPQPQTYSGISGEFLVARQQATLTATPASGWNFYEFNNYPYWLNGGLSANPKSFYVPDDGIPIDTTTYFSNLPTYTVDVTPETFSSNLYAYVDGNFWEMPKSFTPLYDGTWNAGTTHALNIDSPEYPYSSNSRYSFSSWSDGGAQSHTTSPIPGSNTSYIATVSPQYQPATNFSYPPCGGTGAISPASPTSDGFYPAGQSLTFTATPNSGAGWLFGGWTNEITGSTNPAGLTANDETLAFANFNTIAAPLTLTSLSPASVVAGSGAFTLTLHGTGFTANSVVFINNTYRASAFVDSNTLQVAMTTLDDSSATAFQVFVENYPNGWNGCAVYGALTFVVQGATAATLLSPTPNSLLSSSATFSWTAGQGVSAYFLSIGTNGYGGANVWQSGSTSATSATVPNLPLNGATLYVTIFSMFNGTWHPVYYTFSESQLAAITSPTPSSRLPGSATFQWTAGTGVTAYFLSLGTNGPGSANLWQSGSTTSLSATVNTLSLNGVTLNATLFSMIHGVWKPNYFTYSESKLAAITSPTPNTTLPGSSATFTWSAGVGATAYFLSIGTNGAGSANIWESGSTSSLTATPTNLPRNGAAIYVTLFSMINGVWKPNYYTYTEASSGPAAPRNPSQHRGVASTEPALVPLSFCATCVNSPVASDSHYY